MRDSLVMYDRETDTLWTQVDGRGIRGALNQRALQAVPSVHTTWKAWKALYPQSRVLRKRRGPGSAYESYNRNPNELGSLVGATPTHDWTARPAFSASVRKGLRPRFRSTRSAPSVSWRGQSATSS